MKRPRCPKCNFGRIEKLGEILRHHEIKGVWRSQVVSHCWECKKCQHTWQTAPGKKP